MALVFKEDGKTFILSGHYTQMVVEGSKVTVDNQFTFRGKNAKKVERFLKSQGNKPSLLQRIFG